MRKTIAISIIFIIISGCLALSANANKTTAAADDQVYGRCLQPFKPMLPIKPFWCRGTWTQILRCDQRCNCYWEAVCLQ